MKSYPSHIAFTSDGTQFHLPHKNLSLKMQYIKLVFNISVRRCILGLKFDGLYLEIGCCNFFFGPQAKIELLQHHFKFPGRAATVGCWPHFIVSHPHSMDGPGSVTSTGLAASSNLFIVFYVFSFSSILTHIVISPSVFFISVTYL